MKVSKGSIVTVSYSVKVDGEVIEGATPEAPIQYLHGDQMLLPSIEDQVEGMEEGENKKFEILPADAYGNRDETNVIMLPLSVFPPTVDLSVGARLAAKTTSGSTYPMTVVEIGPEAVKVDMNHPLAGKTLHLDMTVVKVREAGAFEANLSRMN